MGCGARLDRTWKYCIYCGIPVDATVSPEPIAPATPLRSAEHRDDTTGQKSGRGGNIALLIGGIAAFLVGVALVVIAIAYAVGALT